MLRVRRPRIPLATLIASVLVLAGFLLSIISWGFIAISAVAMFTPGILREIGLLRDKDEFQLDASRRAGYHAYLAGGLYAFLQAAWFRVSEASAAYPGALLENVLIIMWFTWFFSFLCSYWGAHRCARRVLLVFGILWLVFNVLSGEGNLAISVMQSLLAIPFFLLFWSSRRWPRLTGGLLVIVAAFLFHFFGLAEAFAGDPTLKGRVPVMVLFIGLLLASGLALLGSQALPAE